MAHHGKGKGGGGFVAETTHFTMPSRCGHCGELYTEETCANCARMAAVFTVKPIDKRSFYPGGGTQFVSYPGCTFQYEQPFRTESWNPPRDPCYVPYFPQPFGPQQLRIPPVSRIVTPEDVSPGGQDIREHYFVTQNRYPGEQRAETVYMKPQMPPAEPYTRSLYQTPYDTTQNLIATGTLVNPYLGESYETFENQLPPPNTSRGAGLASQLEHINPKLLWAQGGWNHHDPPPPRREQSGEVFKPVSSRGGAVPYGSANLYTPIVNAQLKQIVQRDIFNNRDGDRVACQLPAKEAPAGYIGYNPAFRVMPYLPATQHLDLKGRMVGAEEAGLDLTKREQYTGQHYARKFHAIVTDRPVNPSNLMNGVQAVTLIPIATDHVGRFGLGCMTYITPACLADNGGAPYVHAPLPLERTGLQLGGTSVPVASLGAAQSGPTVQAVGDYLTRPAKMGADWTLPIASGGGGGGVGGGQGLPPGFQGAPTRMGEAASFPVSSVDALDGQGLLLTGVAAVRPSERLVQGTRLAGDPALPQTGAVLVGQQEISRAAKQELSGPLPLGGLDVQMGQEVFANPSSFVRATTKPEAETLPVLGLAMPEPVAGVVVPDHILRETLKAPAVTHPIGQAQELQDLGSLLLSQHHARPTPMQQQETHRVPGDAAAPELGTLLVSSHSARPPSFNKQPETLRLAGDAALPLSGSLLIVNPADILRTTVMKSQNPLPQGAFSFFAGGGGGQTVPLGTVRFPTNAVQGTFPGAMVQGPEGSLVVQTNTQGQGHGGKIGQASSFPVGAFAPGAAGEGPVFVIDRQVHPTLKPNALTLRSPGDPNLQNAGTLVVSKTDHRTAKISAGTSLPLGNASALETMGEVLVSQAAKEARPTERLITTNPAGAPEAASQGTLVFVDKTLHPTQRQVHETVTRAPAQDGARFGNEVPLLGFSSNDLRGLCPQPYLTAQSAASVNPLIGQYLGEDRDTKQSVALVPFRHLTPSHSSNNARRVSCPTGGRSNSRSEAEDEDLRCSLVDGVD